MAATNSSSRSLKVVTPQLPAQIDIQDAKKKLVTVTLTEADFTPDEVPLIGLSVTVSLSIPFSARKKLMALASGAQNNTDIASQFTAEIEAIDLLKDKVLTGWNLVNGGVPLPLSAFEDLPDEHFGAVVKAILKGLQGGLNPN